MRFELKNILTLGISAILMVGLISFSSTRNSKRTIHDVLIDIEQKNGNYFIDQPEVLGLLNAQNTDYVLGSTIGDIDLKLLESRVEAHAFVSEAQVYYDLRGNVQVKIKQARPIARIFNSKGKDWYIDTTGKILPTNVKHTARVPLVELDKKMTWNKNIFESEDGKALHELLSYIDQDEFWKAQIAQIIVEKSGEVVMLPQVTKQKILFGFPDDLATKFRKLKMFYKEILPNKGWNTYALVNLKFKDQIVCE